MVRSNNVAGSMVFQAVGPINFNSNPNRRKKVLIMLHLDKEMI